jgi:hypothetical protein
MISLSRLNLVGHGHRTKAPIAYHDRKQIGRNTMNVKPRYFAMMLGAGAVAVALASAPGAVAANPTNTHDSGAATTTHRPGHVSIYTEPPLVSPPQVWGSYSSPLFVLGD